METGEESELPIFIRNLPHQKTQMKTELRRAVIKMQMKDNTIRHTVLVYMRKAGIETALGRFALTGSTKVFATICSIRNHPLAFGRFVLSKT